MVTHPGVYCLRSSETDWDEDALWRTYTTLTDVEARLPLAQVRARPASHLPPQAGAGRRPPVHHRHRLPTRAGHPHAAARARRTRQVDHATLRPRRPAARHRHLPPARRTHAACAHGNPSRTRSAGHLRRARRRPTSRRRPQDARLTDRFPGSYAFVVPLGHFCRCKPLILKWFSFVVGKLGSASNPTPPRSPPSPPTRPPRRSTRPRPRR